MKIRTLWETSPDFEDSPWLVAACDEYSIEACDGLPDGYAKEMKDGRRELVIEIPEGPVRKLFSAPIVKGEVKP